jgi:hypothetical protein
MDEYVYVIVHTPAGDRSMRYYGLGVQVISDMLATQGLTGTVVSKETHDIFVSEHSGD